MWMLNCLLKVVSHQDPESTIPNLFTLFLHIHDDSTMGHLCWYTYTPNDIISTSYKRVCSFLWVACNLYWSWTHSYYLFNFLCSLWVTTLLGRSSLSSNQVESLEINVAGALHSPHGRSMVISCLREKGSSSARIRGNAHMDLALCP